MYNEISWLLRLEKKAIVKVAALLAIVKDNAKVVAPANKNAKNKIGRIPLSKEL
jgi:hypothetical protein